MINRVPVKAVMPQWASYPADRFATDTTTQTAWIQVLRDPTYVYMVTGEPLPGSIAEALALAGRWQP
jgi:hypothetical protein